MSVLLMNLSPSALILPLLLVAAAALGISGSLRAASSSSASEVEILRNVEYGTGGGRPLQMIIAHPKNPEGLLPAILYIHGGGWREGSPEAGLGYLQALAARGFLVATIEYRLSREAKWPAQIEDCKCAVRFLRANAKQYGINADRIGAMGHSAGGHLASLLGLSSQVPELEGNGGWSTFSSSVQAVCDWFGPTDFRALIGLPLGEDSTGPVAQLFGSPVSQVQTQAAQASPLAYVGKGQTLPPFLIIHGENDPIVPVSQSIALSQALERAGAQVVSRILPGAGHGGPAFQTQEQHQLLSDFLRRNLAK